MPRQIFVNLPVKDLRKSMAFFSALGFSFNKQFTDDTAASLVISDHIYAMLLTHPKFEQFVTHPIADATKATEVLVALSCESRGEVDRIVDQALASGASAHQPPQDHGFMYLRSFADPDGHVWEVARDPGRPRTSSLRLRKPALFQLSYGI
jgi:uncharacterized protein